MVFEGTRHVNYGACRIPAEALGEVNVLGYDCRDFGGSRVLL